MVSNRCSRFLSWTIAAFVLFALAGPMAAGAQQSAGDGTLPMVDLIVDASLRAEPSQESAELEYLVAGTTVTLMEEPFVSEIDGVRWVWAATLQSLGYLPVDVLPGGDAAPAEEAPAEETPAELPAITGWDTIRDPNPVSCRYDPLFDANVIIELWQGEEIGLTAESFGEWQPVICAGTAGFVPTSAFIAPVEGEPVTEPTDVPATETPVTEAPEVGGEQMLVEVAALPVGAAYVSGTNGDGVRCRSGASLDSPTITVLGEGASVTVRGGQIGSFQQVICAGEDGYVWAEYLSGGTSGGASSSGFGQVQGTNGDGLRCRASADLAGLVITVLSPGATVSLRGAAQGSWQPVTCAGQNGWVHTDFLGASSGSSGSGNSDSASHSFAAGQSARVSGTNGDGVKFRSSASYSGATIYVLSEGVGLTVRSGSTGVWVAVSHGGNNGFVHSDFLTRGTGTSGSSSGSPSSSALATGSNARVTESLRLRSSASFSSSTLDIAPTGMVVRITGAPSNGFYPVRWDDLNGYMHGDYLTSSSSGLSDRPVGSTTTTGNAGSGSGSASGQALVNYAMRYLGYPYVWGGRSPAAGFDCAGLTYWVALQVLGKDIGGGVWAQWTAGTPVAYGNLRPGDLVYFQNTYMPGLSHIGIYVGNNQFVHASNPTSGVIVSDITNSYYAPRYFGARRIV
jgi:cell wall-associated NlpC family hydrolase